jgi:hypothetical protein
VRANPKPNNEFALTTSEDAIMIAHAHRPDVCAKRLELDRRMKWIALPDFKLVPRQTLNMGR